MLKAGWHLHFILPIAMTALCPIVSARADFFDNARQTFQQDIPHFFQSDVPHFFQDDIPCAFGGQPTSHTKTSCKSPRNSAQQRAGDNVDNAPVGQDESRQSQEPTVYDK
jgi:hypothetical protein